MFVDKFRFWAQKVLPTEYDDSLSYYEVLNKMDVKLNQVIDAVNENTETVQGLDTDVEGAKNAALAAQESAENAEESAAQALASAQAAQESAEYIEENLIEGYVLMGINGGYIVPNSDVVNINTSASSYRDDNFALVKQFGVTFLNFHINSIKPGTYTKGNWYVLGSIDSSITDHMPSRFYGMGTGYFEDRNGGRHLVDIVAQYGDTTFGVNGVRFRLVEDSITTEGTCSIDGTPIPVTYYIQRS